MRMWKWLAGATLVGAGAVAVACSTSSSSPGPDAGEDTGAGGDAAPIVEAAACEASTMNSSTLDAGSATWSCLENGCKTSLTACAADCECNNTILAALQCVAMMGGADAGSSTMLSCFTGQITMHISNMNVMTVAACLQQMSPGCGGPMVEGGAEGGEGGPSEAGASDATGQ